MKYSSICFLISLSIPYLINSSHLTLEENNSIYESINWLHEEKSAELFLELKNALHTLIAWISNPIPHQELLTTSALFGNVSDVTISLQNNYSEWLQWQIGWIVLFAMCLTISYILPLLYIIFRLLSSCWSACCMRRKRSPEKKRKNVSVSFLFLICFDILMVTTCVLLAQYSRYGYTTLRLKLRQSLDDVLLYRNQNEKKLQSILLDDFQQMNQTTIQRITSSSQNIIKELKKFTGLDAIEVLKTVGEDSKILLQDMQMTFRDIDSLNELSQKAHIGFTRLRKTVSQDLHECLQKETELSKDACLQALNLLESLDHPLFELQKEDVLPAALSQYVQSVSDLGLETLGNNSSLQLSKFETFLSNEIDSKILSPQFFDAMRKIGDDLFVMFETISNQARSVNLDFMYKNVDIIFNDDASSSVTNIIWISLTVFCALLVAGSFFFLFGALICVCNSEIYNTTGCNTITGKKFLKFGLGLKIFILIMTGWLASVLLVTAGNTSYMICDPIRDPILRPDFVSLIERYIDELHVQGQIKPNVYNLISSRTPSQILRSCQENETLFVIFGLDKYFHLDQIKEFEKDAYRTLSDLLTQTLSDLPDLNFPPISFFISDNMIDLLEEISKMKPDKQSNDTEIKLRKEHARLNFIEKLEAFTDETKKNVIRLPNQIKSMIELINDFNAHLAAPLRKIIDTVRLSSISHENRVSAIRNAIQNSLGNLNRGKKIVLSDVKTEIRRETKAEMISLRNGIDQYITQLQNKVKSELIPCRTITDILKLPVHGFCSNIVDPLIAFGLTLLLTTIFVVPLIHMALKTTSVPQKNHFSKQAVDDSYEFSTDTYAPALKP